MVGASKFQVLRHAAEPYLTIQSLGPLPIGIVIGVLGGIVTFLLLENKRLPAGLLIVIGGMTIGLIFGTHEGLEKLTLSIYIPPVLPTVPSSPDFAFALFALVLPQIPMTLGNAVIAYKDLSKEYFGDDSRKVTYRSACLSMACANGISFFLGGMPLCHGAGLR